VPKRIIRIKANCCKFTGQFCPRIALIDRSADSRPLF
jgi:hypothetical protein